MDELDATPCMTESACPECSPERDFLRELLTVAYCSVHYRHAEGDLDSKIGPSLHVNTGAGEADGQYCRAVSDLVRGFKHST